jgi:pimeloyl-ACP methyl ester carboxylesterase
MQLEVISQQPATSTTQPPILFVHGAWHGAWCWAEHFVPYFAAAGYPVTALSFRAHGASDGNKRPRGKRIAQYAADVVQVAEQLRQPPIIISHSMGTLVAQKYLERHPARAHVMLNPVPPGGVWATTLRIAGRHPGPFLLANLTWRLYPIVGSPQLTRDAFFRATMPEAQVQAYFQQIQDESYVAFLDMLALNLAHPKRVQARHPMPVLVLGGSADRIFPPREVQQTARAYGTTATIFPDLPHDMMLDADWQTVADHIRAWLGEHVAP